MNLFLFGVRMSYESSSIYYLREVLGIKSFISMNESFEGLKTTDSIEKFSQINREYAQKPGSIKTLLDKNKLEKVDLLVVTSEPWSKDSHLLLHKMMSSIQVKNYYHINLSDSEVSLLKEAIKIFPGKWGISFGICLKSILESSVDDPNSTLFSKIKKIESVNWLYTHKVSSMLSENSLKIKRETWNHLKELSKRMNC